MVAESYYCDIASAVCIDPDNRIVCGGAVYLFPLLGGFSKDDRQVKKIGPFGG